MRRNSSGSLEKSVKVSRILFEVDSSAEGSVSEGFIVEGAEVKGPLVEGDAFKGSTAEESLAGGSTIKDSLVDGPVVEYSTALIGRSMVETFAVEDSG